VARNRAVTHEDRLTLVEHLDELRNRIIVSLAAFGVAFALCFWQDNLMLDIANWPLPPDTIPITLSPTEPFTTTIKVSAYGAAILSLPIILYQVYAFIMPAFSPAEKRVVLPYVIAMPLLFVAGVAFTYFLVTPAAVKFLLNFNEANFSIQVRAGDYYTFLGVLVVMMGLLFQMPIALLSLCRLGVITPDQLSEYRRYAILIIAIVSAAAPGGDPVSMFMIMIPLLLLYEASVLLAKRFGQPRELPPADPAPQGSG
jgi:sec-independent protein translocase protein TatC